MKARVMFLVPLVWMLTACVDADGDGYTADVDCDDADPAVHPDAAEACNGVDDNCNGSVDDGAPAQSWFGDEDRDGYGSPFSWVVACPAPAGYIPRGGDCDDEHAEVHPGADELCNGVDDNCNGAVDEDLGEGCPSTP